jgi:CubicO group peptidase (beta-lactamase class C family)
VRQEPVMISATLALLALPQTPSLDAEAAWNYAANYRTQSMLVLQNGKVIFERYANGGAENRRQMLASGTKSFTGVAALFAREDGIIPSLDAPAATWITEWATDPQKSKITLAQLLSLTSGISPGGPGTSSGQSQWSAMIGLPMVTAPGSAFRYGGSQQNLFALALDRALKKKDPFDSFERYLQRRLLDPLGIQLEWRIRLQDGNPQVAGGSAMTARDWATFGEFIRQGGVHNGQRLLPERAVNDLFRPSPAYKDYGLSWWLAIPNPLNLVGRGGPTSTGNPAFAKDMVMAAGAGDQRLYIIRSRNLVIVRQGSISPALPARQGTEADQRRARLERFRDAERWSDAEFLRLLLKG